MSEATIILILALIGLYFLPTFIAGYKQHPNRIPIMLLNVFTGWTLVGWLGALIWVTIKIDKEK